VKFQLRQSLYKFLLSVLNLRVDYRNSKRETLGVSPYPRRSPLLISIYNLRELTVFLMDRSDAKFFKSATRALKDSKRDSEALILGNGPSLVKLNSTRVSSDNPDIWVVNDFYKFRDASNLGVSYYVLSDAAYFLGLPDKENAKLKPVLDYVKDKNATLILPHWAKNLLSKEITSIKVRFFDDRELSAWSKNTNPVNPRGYLGLTLYKALGFALYLGYKKIFVLGMDNTEFLGYGSDEANRLLLLSNHAYQNEDNAYDLSGIYLDGMASAFSSLSHNFGDLLKFKGPIVNLDTKSLTTRFPKERNHPWVS
jgi:hypothetical protein